MPVHQQEKRGMGSETEWYRFSPEDIFLRFHTQEKGLPSTEIAGRMKLYGKNKLKDHHRTSVLELFLRQFRAFVVWVLLAAGVLSYVTGHMIEVVVIALIILFAVLLGFFEEYKASRDMEALLELSPKTSTVLRDGKNLEVITQEITLGDIVVLHRGDIVAADARLLEANELAVDESPLTGESTAITKEIITYTEKKPVSDQKNMVFAGTHVVSGDGRAVVVAIGEHTEIGQISTMMQGIEEQTTPLQKRLDRLTKELSFAAIILAFLVFLFGIWRGNEWSSMLLFSLAVIVSGIPESLPAVVAVTLAAGVKSMAHKQAIVKRLPAVETLGTCTVICSDKTGTLTQNKMVIQTIYTLDAEVKVTGNGYNPEGVFFIEDAQIEPRKHATVSKIIEIGVLCNNADIRLEKEEWIVDGEATEGALIVLARKAGILKDTYHQQYPRKKEHPFDPVRKCMSVVHKVKKKHIAYSKGAPEILIKKALFALHEGKIIRLTPQLKKKFLNQAKVYEEKGLRVLGLAYKEHKGSFTLTNVENQLIFVGLVSMRDPPHPEVKESISKCQAAGTKVVMITGDNELTAKAIAEELGIYHHRDIVLTGMQLDHLKDHEYEQIIDAVSVYARVTPKHKLKIVAALQKKGHIVAMTGDGVNDAPALKKADIGIAMGSGTEVAKEAAEMVLKDDKFTTIVNAMEQGRTTYANIQKFLYFLLLGNFCEVILVVVAVMAGVNLPLTTLMILFVNLVTSDIPALGLSVEKPSPHIMRQKPRNTRESILNEYLLLRITELVPLVVLGTLALYIWYLQIAIVDLPKAQTVTFATIIFFELFHALNAKSLDESIFSKRFFSNHYMLGGILISTFLTLVVIYWSPLQAIFGTIALSVADWIPILLISSSILFFTEIQKTLVSAEFKERAKIELSTP